MRRSVRRRKRWESHCPNSACGGGYATKLRRLTQGERNRIGRSNLVLSPGEKPYICGYCGCVWKQPATARPGYKAKIIGKLDASWQPLKAGSIYR